jgi:hypothetical protein
VYSTENAICDEVLRVLKGRVQAMMQRTALKTGIVFLQDNHA